MRSSWSRVSWNDEDFVLTGGREGKRGAGLGLGGATGGNDGVMALGLMCMRVCMCVGRERVKFKEGREIERARK